ncbi:hypothetical protein [Salisediminibacterium halotolerans]|uniref:Transcriptional regulator n=1 Tax=Salisediminibacterium halotolerans TaxID=517425 RepID=A0A1H9W3F8_9BACI|nr:hypothetical protein [Salisediminibacterium haloalkalitolerans]SES28466.1 hypothetical protein SAMN05444126_12717 [Salisediminibacterium haloalkalitolerans]
MQIRLGVIGPKDSVDKIINIAKAYPDFILYSFAYEHTEETPAIVAEHNDYIDQWLFSGQSPYALALAEGLISEETALFPPHHGSSLLGALLEASYNSGAKMAAVSVDTLDDSEIAFVRETYSLQALTVHGLPYSGYMPPDELSAFHREKYRSGEAEIAFTTIRSVYQTLAAEGIPVYRITVTKPTIEVSLRLLKERGQANWYRKSQLAIVGVEIFEAEQESEAQQYSYKRKHQELELKRLLLDYTEELKGSFVQMGDGLFYIYTTRGEIESHPSPFYLLESAQLQAKLAVRLGAGYGVTALEAEEHVRLALKHARKPGTSAIISVDETKQITEVFADDEPVSYDSRRLSEDVKAKLGERNLSPGVVSKLASSVKHYQKQTVTSQEIAQWLASSERNARRILLELEDAGLAEIVGEEQSGSRGRPRKIYRLDL